MHEVLRLPSDDYLNVMGLNRVDYHLVTHPNKKMMQDLERYGMQLYLLDKTAFGCIVQSEEDAFNILWIKVDPDISPGQFTIVEAPNFEELLDQCDDEQIGGILYHLDVFWAAEKMLQS